MSFQRARRLDALPPYLFIEIDRKKRAAIAAGRDVISFGVGDPDRPTPRFIIDRMAKAIDDPANHTYPQGEGSPAFREACAAWFSKRFGVTLDAKSEVLALIGTKEGLGHLPLAVVNPGDVGLIPSPGYPVYAAATLFAGGETFTMPLDAERGFVPDLDAIPAEVLDRAAVMFLNYPNNPTSACAPLSVFEKAVALAKRHGFVVCSDAAYSEVYFDEADRPHSVLEVDGAKDVAVELHSLSKTFNMTGWRGGFAVGHADVLSALAKVKGNMDSGVFTAVQEAAIAAIERIDSDEVALIREVYRERRDRLLPGLKASGFTVDAPKATFYVWARCPAGYDSMGCVSRLLEEAGIVAIPGIGFGKNADDFVRFALTVDLDRIEEAASRMAKLTW